MYDFLVYAVIRMNIVQEVKVRGWRDAGILEAVDGKLRGRRWTLHHTNHNSITDMMPYLALVMRRSTL
jgi:hypothetical protein